MGAAEWGHAPELGGEVLIKQGFGRTALVVGATRDQLGGPSCMKLLKRCRCMFLKLLRGSGHPSACARTPRLQAYV